ncbi:Secretory carrier-associated membrane protein [Schistosoma japonicum]|nr:Secretory carrier-associated membrane protein [Schistosoma japonicum]KAH8877430.1 Secretory carrier-associated membrane protein [Schistosoma japonicum]
MIIDNFAYLQWMDHWFSSGETFSSNWNYDITGSMHVHSYYGDISMVPYTLVYIQDSLIPFCIFTYLIQATTSSHVKFVTYGKVHHIYRSTGASFGKAKQEFTHGIISDPLIRNGAVEAGLFAARQTTSAGS